ELVGIVARTGWTCSVIWRVSRGTAVRDLVDAAGDVVEARVHRAHVVLVIVVAERSGIDAVLLRLLDDDGVEPLAERHAGAARGLHGRLAGFRTDAFDAPRHAEFHARIRLRGGGKEPEKLSWNRRALTAGGNGPGPLSTHRLFAVHGKQDVKKSAKCRTWPENFCCRQISGGVHRPLNSKFFGVRGSADTNTHAAG